MSETAPAPSEENILYCDVDRCPSTLSMVNDVPREEHGWGRITVYEGLGGVTDFDLCPKHTRRVHHVLAGHD